MNKIKLNIYKQIKRQFELKSCNKMRNQYTSTLRKGKNTNFSRHNEDEIGPFLKGNLQSPLLRDMIDLSIF